MSVREIDDHLKVCGIAEFTAHAGRRREEASAPWPGQMAPDFRLEAVDPQAPAVCLSELRGGPVALVFGSHSCARVRRVAPEVSSEFNGLSGGVQPLFVYIAEAHPSDEAPHPRNEREGVRVPLARSRADRRTAAALHVAEFGIRGPAVIDDTADSVATAYGASLGRLYVIDKDGVVHWRSPPGPFGYVVEPWADALRELADSGGRTKVTFDPAARRRDQRRLWWTPNPGMERIRRKLRNAVSPKLVRPATRAKGQGGRG